MCGIFGVLTKKENSLVPEKEVADKLQSLLLLSESRGHDSSGIAVLDEKKISVFKKDLPANKLVKTPEFKELTADLSNPVSIIGHARMETNGSFTKSYNNQPVVKDDCIIIHNGIIVNVDELWKKVRGIKRKYEVDTEVIASLFRKYLESEKSIVPAIQKSVSHLKGAFSIATFFADMDYLLLATNMGSQYLLQDKDSQILIFASEKYFLEKLVEREFSTIKNKLTITQIKPGTGILVEIGSLKLHKFNLERASKKKLKNSRLKKRNIEIIDQQEVNENLPEIFKTNEKNRKRVTKIIEKEYEQNSKKIEKLQRCTKCILPETMPFIDFDDKGVCKFCRNYSKIGEQGHKALEKVAAAHRKKDGSPDCIVMFSGGRDSSYGLHYVKEELKMNPVAYSYDWGMITDLGRRNQARMTGVLGIEHILISADIQKKRENVRKNVEAWLKKPDLGTVPLFMAGDKQYFYHANQLRKQMNIDLVILCENLMERTDFKSGFCGIRPKKLKGKNFYQLTPFAKLKMAFYYGMQYLKNPSYINSSLIDSLSAFKSYYVIPHEYLSLYKYIKWEEKKVEKTLLGKKYDWEVATDTPTTWRIGDGTASFYNYIYYTMSGLSENDTFRSNQIREGDLTRKKALKIANTDNKPRLESLEWYANTIGFDLKKAIEIINSAPKLY